MDLSRASGASTSRNPDKYTRPRSADGRCVCTRKLERDRRGWNINVITLQHDCWEGTGRNQDSCWSASLPSPPHGTAGSSVGLYLGPYGGPMEGRAVSHERSTPVGCSRHADLPRSFWVQPFREIRPFPAPELTDVHRTPSSYSKLIDIFITQL